MSKKSKLTNKNSFYVILFICVCVVGFTSVWASKKNLDKMKSQKEPLENEDFVIVEDEKELEGEDLEKSSVESLKQEKSKKEENEKKQKEKQKEEVNNEKTNKEEVNKEEVNKEEVNKEEVNKEEVNKEPITTNANSIQTFHMPVDGEMGLDFSDGKLVYSKTLEEWTSHEGIDIKGTEGTKVKACLDGVVKEVNEDRLWGVMISIDHGNGLETRYANLSRKDMVKPGQKVKKGEPISEIGKSRGLEMKEGPHLHLEVVFNKKKVDPKKYLSSFN